MGDEALVIELVDWDKGVETLEESEDTCEDQGKVSEVWLERLGKGQPSAR